MKILATMGACAGFLILLSLRSGASILRHGVAAGSGDPAPCSPIQIALTFAGNGIGEKSNNLMITGA